MLYDLDRTIEKMLVERGNLNSSEIDISFEQPTSEWTARMNRPTLNCWAFDLRENTKLRNMDINMSVNGNRGILQLAPLRFNVTYLITAWTRRPEDEHVLLWRALSTLCKAILLRKEECEGSLKDQPYDMPVQVAQMGETSFNMTDLWSVLDNQLHLGFTYMVTLAVDPERVYEVPLVLEGHIGIGQAQDLPAHQTIIAPDMEIIHQLAAEEKPSKKKETSKDRKLVYKNKKYNIVRNNRKES